MPLSATFKRIFIKSQRMEVRARIDRFNDHHILWKDNRARRTRKLTTLCIKNRQTANNVRILRDAPGSRLRSGASYATDSALGHQQLHSILMFALRMIEP